MCSFQSGIRNPPLYVSLVGNIIFLTYGDLFTGKNMIIFVVDLKDFIILYNII